MSDVAVLGAGIMGLSIARELGARGAKVTVLERASAAGEASGAAAGILSLLAEVPHGDRMWPLVARAASLWERFAADVAAESGIDAGFARRGFMALALSPSEDEALSELLVKAARLSVRVAKISGPDARRQVPPLARAVLSAVQAPGDAQIDPAAFCQGLVVACRRRGVEIREGTEVTRVVPDGAGFRVTAAGADHTFGKVVVTLGAWSATLGLPPLGEGDVTASRGQMLCLETPDVPEAPVLYRPGHGYLVLRPTGSVIAGSTLESGIYAKNLTTGGLGAITKNALSIMPGLADAVVARSWAGLRPQSKDGLPLIGEGGAPGLYFCTGHFRSGILLAPASAEAVADLVTGAPHLVDLSLLAPARVIPAP